MPYPNDNSPRNVTKYLGQGYSFAPRYLRNRDPSTNDIKPKEQQGYYSTGTFWTNVTNGNLWALQKITSNLANWILLSTGATGPALSFLTPDANVVMPTGAGQVTFANGAGISVTGATPNTITITNTFQAQTFVTDVNSPALPAAGILDVIGGATTVNTTNGVRTNGSAPSNILTVELTNRLSGSVTTTNATPTTLISFAMSSANLGASIGVATFDIQIAGFNTTDTAGVGYSIFGSVRTDGASTTLIGTPDKIVNEEASQATADANLIVTGNTIVVQVTGIAAKTINWKSVATYVFVN